MNIYIKREKSVFQMERKRIQALVAGIFLYICLGFQYSWSNYIDFLERDQGWSRTELAAVFTVCMLCFAAACFLGGTLSQKIGALWVMRLGAVSIFLGLIGSSFAASVLMLCVCFGGLCGGGIGIAYIAAMPCVQQRFPDRLGLISGVLLMTYGLGGTILGTVTTALMAATDWRTGFRVLGIAMGIVMLLASGFLREPDAEEKLYLEERRAQAERGKKAGRPPVETVGIEADMRTMLSRKSFWYYFIWYVLISSLWMGAVGQAATYALDMGAGLKLATLTAGAITFFNGAGRLFAGWLHDVMPRRRVMMGISALVLVAVVLMYLGLKFSILWLLILSVSLIGLGYGASATTNPVFIRRFFGQKNYAQNLGIVNCNGLFSAILGSTMGPLLIQRFAGYDVMMIYFIVLIAIAFVLQLGIKEKAQ